MGQGKATGKSSAKPQMSRQSLVPRHFDADVNQRLLLYLPKSKAAAAHQPLFLLLKQIVDFTNQLHEFVWILLDGCLLTEFSPTLFGLPLHT